VPLRDRQDEDQELPDRQSQQEKQDRQDEDHYLLDPSAMGRRGGRARMKALSAAERRELARKAGKASGKARKKARKKAAKEKHSKGP
jgi:hypothetical protein